MHRHSHTARLCAMGDAVIMRPMKESATGIIPMANFGLTSSKKMRKV